MKVRGLKFRLPFHDLLCRTADSILTGSDVAFFQGVKKGVCAEKCPISGKRPIFETNFQKGVPVLQAGFGTHSLS